MATRHQRITIYSDDDATPLLGAVDGSGNVVTPTCTTDPAGARPYLIRALDQGESSIDIIEGTSLSGSMSVKVLDKRTVATDQTTGWFTALLADPTTKQGQLMGHRIQIEQSDSAGVWYTVMDGVISDVELDDDFVTYQLSVKDMRDRERKVRCFTKSSGLSVFPRGFVSGYGRFGAAMVGVDVTYLAGPVIPGKATFYTDPGSLGLAGLARLDKDTFQMDTDYANELAAVCGVTQKFLDHPFTDRLRGNVGTYVESVFGNIKVYWRPRGSTGAYTTLSNMPVLTSTYSNTPSAFTMSSRTWFNKHLASDCGFIFSSRLTGGTDLPANGQQIDFFIEYVGIPTDKYPLYIEDTFGNILKNLYDGTYSDEPTRIRYNATTVAAFNAACGWARVKITEPQEDIRTWAENALYKPNFYAPSIDPQGRISPVSGKLPPAGVTLINLDDTNIIKGKWLHASDTIANKVIVKCVREYLLLPGSYAENTSPIAEREVELVMVHPSVLLNGDHRVEYDPGTLRSMGRTYNGDALTGVPTDEAGTKIAQGRAQDLFDRFAYGVQRMEVVAQRRDVGVSGAKVGDWVTIGSSHMPDYVTGKRGISRVAQIISIKDIDPASRTLTLLDGGASTAPASVPTIGALSYSNGCVTIPITALPSGAVAVEYAVSPTLPASSDGLWMFAGRLTSVGNIVTPTIPPKATVWARARSVGDLIRPSAFVYSSAVTVPLNPMPVGLRLVIDDNTDPILYWDGGTALGLRVGYGVLSSSAAAGLTTVFTNFGDVDIATGKLVLTGVKVKQYDRLTVQVVGYSGFAAGAVSGTAGIPTTVYATRVSPDIAWPTMLESTSEDGATGTLTLTPVDPQFRLTRVEAATTQADGTFGAYADVALSGSTYVITVPMRDKQPSLIKYRLTAITTLGATAVIDENPVRFAIGARPIPPDVSYQIGADGTLTVTSRGDSDTTLHHIVVKLDTAATVPEVDAASGANAIGGRTAIYTYPSLLTPGQKFYIGVKAYNESLPGGSLTTKGSDLVPQTDQWISPSAASATVSVVTPPGLPAVAVDYQEIVISKIMLGALTSHVDVFVREFRTDPGSAVDISSTGYRAIGSPLYTSGSSIYIPVVNPSNYFLITLKAIDAINRVGVGQTALVDTPAGIVNLKVQAAASPVSPPNDPANLVLTSPAIDSVNLAITMPSSNLGVVLRVFRDGAPVADVPVTAIHDAVQNYVDTGRTPGSSYTYQVYMVNSAGTLSPLGSTIRTISLAASTIPQPTVSVGAYDVDAGGYTVTITPGTGSPSGITWQLEHQTDQVDGTTGSRIGYNSFSNAESQTNLTFLHAHGRGSRAQYDRVRVSGSKTGYSTSLASAVSSEVPIPIYIPGLH